MSGRVWSSGGRAISMLDPTTKQWPHFDLAGTYGNVIGHNGDEWFTASSSAGPIGRVSKDRKLSKFQPPTNGKPQRLQVDENNIVWFSEREGTRSAASIPRPKASRSRFARTSRESLRHRHRSQQHDLVFLARAGHAERWIPKPAR